MSATNVSTKGSSSSVLYPMYLHDIIIYLSSFYKSKNDVGGSMEALQVNFLKQLSWLVGRERAGVESPLPISFFLK